MDPREDSYRGVIQGMTKMIADLRQESYKQLQRIEALEAAQQPAPATEESSATAPNTAIFPVEYADSDGDGIRILMEPADETGQGFWFVRNSRYVNPCHEFSSPEDAYAAHRRAQPATAPPAPAGGLVGEICRQLPLSPGEVRAVVREVVAWLRSEPWLGRAAADRLEQEANQ